jgi:pentatricopeptide repeat protein
MHEFLSKFDGGELIGLVAVAGGLLCGILCGVTGIVMGCLVEMRKTEAVAALKQDMLNRGMSADEIRMVIEAGSPESLKALKRQHACRS